MSAPAAASFPPPGRLRRVDARVKIVLLIGACLVSQYLPAAWLPPWILALSALFTAREMRTAEIRSMLQGGIWFTLFWLAMKMVSDLLAGGGAWTALLAGLPVAGRLLALSLAGIALIGLSSPIETGRAAAWFIRPLAGRRAWKPALAVALTAWFLPQCLRLVSDVRAAIRARGLRLSPPRAAFVITGTALRILQRKADELAVGLASRRLDDYRSWK